MTTTETLDPALYCTQLTHPNYGRLLSELEAEAAARVAALYSASGYYVGSAYEQRIAAWMTKHGHPGYEAEIQEAQAAYCETRGEAGRYGDHCEFTQERLATINTAIREAFRAATDRYEDWASD